jgi:hypothetical protein
VRAITIQALLLFAMAIAPGLLAGCGARSLLRGLALPGEAAWLLLRLIGRPTLPALPFKLLPQT